MSVVISILAAIIVLGILIIVHEGGHFLMGKWLGFRIIEFSVGMGPKLISREKNGTIYSLRAFPIGGMCAFDGEDQDSPSEGAFNTFPAWKRFLVAFAGPFMNIVTAFVFAIILVLIFGQYQTVSMENPQIASFAEHSPAQQSGLMEGDVIISVNGNTVNTSDEMISHIRNDTDGNIDFVVLRPSQQSYYTVNGTEISNEQINDFAGFAKEHPAKAYTASLENAQQLNITVKNSYNKETGYNVIGASITDALCGYDQKYNPITAIPAGSKYVVDVMDKMFEFLGSLFKGNVSVNDVSGIVGVVDVVNSGVSTVMEDEQITAPKKASVIIEFIMYLAVLLSINLGIMNLLPLPALDGGRILFNIIEMVARKPIPVKVEGMIHTIGLFVLLAFIAFITVKDLIYLFI